MATRAITDTVGYPARKNTRTLPHALLLLAACSDKGDEDDDFTEAPPVLMDGTWSGTCGLQADGYVVDIDLVMDITEGEADTGAEPLTGTASADYSERSWSGTMTGSRAPAAADAIVSLETELDDEVFTITVLLDGALSGTSWAGECILGGIAGNFELTQS